MNTETKISLDKSTAHAQLLQEKTLKPNVICKHDALPIKIEVLSHKSYTSVKVLSRDIFVLSSPWSRVAKAVGANCRKP
jgi:hypothetical protein